MPTSIPLTYPTDVNFSAESTIKHYLSNIGWQEVYTYSMVSEELAEQSGSSLAGHAKLANPLTDDKVYLRRSLIPSLQEVLSANSQHDSLSLFELANVYQPAGKTEKKASLPKENLQLVMLSTKPLREVKGDLTSLLKQFHLPQPKVKPGLDEGVGSIMINDTKLGVLKVLNKLTAVELEVARLLPLIKTHPQYQPLPKTASVIEQFTFTLPLRTTIGPIIEDIKKLSPKVKTVTLVGVYQQNHTLTVEYWDPKKNLTNSAVRPIRKRIVKVIEKSYQAKLVGKL
jgi:phenylalanyl-tRNA synthetase beta chain